MTDQKKDKLIVEALGGCWHNWTYFSATALCADESDYQCSKCGQWKSEQEFKSLATPEGFFWIWERAQKKEWWPIFKAWFWGHDGVRHLPMMIPEEFIDPIRGRDALAEWLRNNEDKWKS